MRVRALHPGESGRIGEQGVCEVRIDAALVEDVGVGVAKLNGGHSRQAVIDRGSSGKPTDVKFGYCVYARRIDKIHADAAVYTESWG